MLNRSVKKCLLICSLVCATSFIYAQQPHAVKENFDIVNLNYPGLEEVKANVTAGNYDAATQALLNYYRQKYHNKEPDVSNTEMTEDINKPIDAATLEMADKALLHQFKPQKGYEYFDYGKDINWQYWPIKDNEIRWQLHRVKWWYALAMAYRATGNEKYAKEWAVQFVDWAKKNPLGLSADNDRYAWRPLEVSDRVQNLVPIFQVFIKSPQFTPVFLWEFLKSYNQQADYLPKNYARDGNHRLFEAQRVLFGGTSFPELKNADSWRKSGIDVLSTEIGKQVYPDGIQFELSTTYHAASIDIFLKAYRAAQSAGLEKEFPDSYRKTIENMIMAYINITFPNYNQPMFGDSWVADKSYKIRQFRAWSEVFPLNKTLQYFATEGKAGTPPNWLSKGLTDAGFYTFRNGWNSAATILTLKASPPGEFHAQPDNGTFELWANGRNLTPDAGCYVYSGDDAINKLRNWYRQTKVHSTLTLNDSNMLITKASLKKWETGKDLDILSYTNPSYAGLEHQRTVLFINQQYFLIIDKAVGNAKGRLGTHFVLKEDSKPVFDKNGNKVYTTYSDNNNLLIQNLNTDKVTLTEEEGKVSYSYRKEVERPAFVFQKEKKDANTQVFVTVLYPYSTAKPPVITIKENAGNDFVNDKIDLTIMVNGAARKVATRL